MLETAIPSLAKDNKAIIQLRKASRISVSDRDIETIVATFTHDIIRLCLECPMDELKREAIDDSELGLNKNKLTFKLDNNGWKCRLSIYIKSLEALRGVLFQYQDVPKDGKFGSHTQLLLRETEYFQAEPILLEEDEEQIPKQEEALVLDDKKAHTKTVYKPRTILGRGIDIVVLSRPGKNEH